jgi:hypothetical protein
LNHEYDPEGVEVDDEIREPWEVETPAQTEEQIMGPKEEIGAKTESPRSVRGFLAI